MGLGIWVRKRVHGCLVWMVHRALSLRVVFLHNSRHVHAGEPERAPASALPHDAQEGRPQTPEGRERRREVRTGYDILLRHHRLHKHGRRDDTYPGYGNAERAVHHLRRTCREVRPLQGGDYRGRIYGAGRRTQRLPALRGCRKDCDVCASGAGRRAEFPQGGRHQGADSVRGGLRAGGGGGGWACHAALLPLRGHGQLREQDGEHFQEHENPDRGVDLLPAEKRAQQLLRSHQALRA
mmetsp:Transcript_13512/g.31509  ORF Transcript_13512/g.31509 Transcript_13512/m.31509 type:complete len:238 (-) Transcript_13512:32-745(-)